MRKRLGEELGIEASAELRALDAAILLQDRELDWHPAGSDNSGEATERRLPTGTVTFLSSEIEGSRRLQQRLGGDRYEEMLADHHRTRRERMDKHHGIEVVTDGDSSFAVFVDARDAVFAALELTLGAGRPNGRAGRIRIGLHTGPGRVGGNSYVGPAAHLAAHACAAAHGGQVVASAATRKAALQMPAATSWVALGRHRLNDLGAPVELFQLRHPDLVARFPPLRSLERVAHNLPIQLSSFLGRADELAMGAKLLAGTKLLSVTGPGGIGKTRLAYQLAAQELPNFPDGVWVAEFASLSGPEAVPARLMTALGLRDEPGRPATETIVTHLRDRTALVVLDNCEHVIEAAASLAAGLLSACAHLRVLTSSREPLRVSGECVWALEPLTLPEAGEEALEVVAGIDAVALFCERAAEAKISFALTLTT